MKTRILKTSLVVVLLALAGASSAQVVINSTSSATPAPDAAAVLWLLGNGSQGLMLPTSNNAAGLPIRNGMVVYDTVLKQIFYCDGTTWKAMGGATISISGNTVTVGASTASLANAGPTQAGQLLFWNGTNWTSTSNTPAPGVGNVLSWSGSTWVPTPLAGGGDMAKATYDPTNKVADAFAFSNHTGTITSAQIADGTVASIDITNGTVTGGAGGDIAGNTITGTELASNIAISTTGSISTIGTGTLSIAGSTTFNGRTYNWPGAVAGVGTVLQNDGSGTLSWVPNGAGMTNPMNSIGDIIYGGAAGAPTSLDGSLGFLKSTGAAAPTWSVVNLASADVAGVLTIARGGTGTGTAPTTGQLLIGNAGNYSLASLSGDISTVSAAGAVTLTNSAGTRTNLGLGVLSTLGAVSGGAAGTITDATIVDADVNGAAAITGTKISPNFGTQNIATTGTLSVTGITTFNTRAYTWPSTAAGASTVLQNDGTGILSWAPISLTGAAAGDLSGTYPAPQIAAGVIVDADVNAAAAIAGTKVSPNFGTQNIATTGTLAVTGTTTFNTRTYSWPSAVAGASTVLQNDGAGALSWGPMTTSGVAAGDLSGTYPAPQIAAGVIVDADVNAAAAIAGTKVSPNFGSQAISTTGNLNINAPGIISGIGSGITTLNATNLSAGTVAITRGGTGTGTAPTNGQLLIGGAGNYAPANITSANLGLTIANGANTIQLTNAWGPNPFTTTGDIIFGTGTVPTVLGAGTAGFVLTSGGPGTAPTWSSPSGGLVLPYSASQSGATLFSITNTGIGANGAGVFSTNNALNTGIGLSASTSSSTTGSAAQFTSTNALATGNVVSMSGAGLGNILNISASNGLNGQAALNINHSGTGNAITANKPIQANTLIATGNVNVNGVNYTWPGANAVGQLTNNGLGTLSWAPAGGFSTLNTIPKGDGSTLVASSIFDNGSVGIGTTTPQGALHTNGGGTNTIRLTNTTSGTTATDGLELSMGPGSTTSLLSRETAGNMILGFNSNNVLFLTSGGQVGVNASSPTAGFSLDVGGSALVQGNLRFSSALMPNNLAGTAGQVLTSAGPGIAPTWTTTVPGISPANTVIRGNAAGTAQVASSFFDNGAYTAINRTTPIGAARFDIATNATSGNYGGMYIDTQGGGKPFYGFAQAGGSVAWIELDGSDAQKMKFFNGAGQLTLTNTGNLGISTTTPVNRLDVEGGMVIGTTFAGSLAAPPNGLGIEGSLGVGTNAPSFDIHLNKAVGNATMKLESGNGWAYMYMDKNAATDNSWIGLMTAGSDRWVIGNYNSTENFRIIDWQNGGAGNGAFYLEKGGSNSVGLGTTTPVNRLDVNGAVAIGSAYAGSSAAPVDGLLVDGNVNFGDTSPQGRFNVGGDGQAQGVIVVNRTLTDGVQIRFRRDGGTVGDISTSGGITSYNAFTGSHYATTQQSINKGMLVSLTGSNQFMEDNPSSEILYGVRMSQIANDSKIMGAYLGLQSPEVTHSSSNPHLVMAVGNGDIWVVDQGQDLEPGDYLVSSAVEGHAMKDIGEFDVSHVVARVAEPVRWSGVSETIHGVKHKRISIFFESFDRNNKAEKLEKDVMEMKEQMKMITQELQRLKSLVGTEARNN